MDYVVVFVTLESVIIIVFVLSLSPDDIKPSIYTRTAYHCITHFTYSNTYRYCSILREWKCKSENKKYEAYVLKITIDFYGVGSATLLYYDPLNRIGIIFGRRKDVVPTKNANSCPDFFLCIKNGCPQVVKDYIHRKKTQELSLWKFMNIE